MFDPEKKHSVEDLCLSVHDRAGINLRCSKDDGYRAAMLAYLSRTSSPEPAILFTNAFLWTEDPRLKGPGKFLPFRLYPRQIELIQWLWERYENGEDGAIPKSRDTGATETILAFMFHRWRFEPMFRGLVGSRKENLVDMKGKEGALMPRLDRFYRNLPKFLQIPSYVPDSPSPHRSEMKMFNPELNSSITGEAPIEDFGRGERFSFTFMDEFPFWPNPEASYVSVGESCDTRILCSTPNGMDFYGRLCNPQPDQVTGVASESIPTFRMHWKDDPRHSVLTWDEDRQEMVNKWYEGRKKRYRGNVEMMNRELEISFEGSVTNRVYPEIGVSGKGNFPYQKNKPLYTTWDFGFTDGVAITWIQYDPSIMRYRAIDYYENKSKAIDFYVPFITGRLPGRTDFEYSDSDLAIIKRHAGWLYDGHFGDPAGKNADQSTGNSSVEILGRHNIHIQVNNHARDFPTRRDETKALLPLMDFDEVRCSRLILCFQNSRYPEIPETAQRTTPNRLPIHNEWSHGRASIEYFAVNNPHKWDHQESEDEGEEEFSSTQAASLGVVYGGSEADTRRLMRQKPGTARAFAKRPPSRFGR